MNPYFLRLLDEIGVREPTPTHKFPTPDPQPHPLADWLKAGAKEEPPH